MSFANFEGGGFFSNTSNPRTTNNTSTTNNASYGNGNPLNFNLSNVATGKYGSITLSPNIQMSDYGAIASAFAFAQNANETASVNGLKMAEIARQAGQPVNSVIEKLGSNLFMIMAIAAVTAFALVKK